MTAPASPTTAGTGDRTPSESEAFWVWLRIGLLSFGGPAGQIALMHRLVVDERQWITQAQFLHALNYCMLLPGPEAQQLATYVGWLLHGTRGGIVAGVLFVLPGLAVIAALSTIYALYLDTGWLDSVFFGLKAAVLAIVVQAVIKVGSRALASWLAVTLAALSFVGIFALNLPFPLIVLGAGLIGFFIARLKPGWLIADAPTSEAVNTSGREEIRHAEATGNAGSHLSRALRLILLWVGIWVAPIAVLALAFGWDSTFVALAVFLSKMAVVTFGGAYAVLAYVAQQAVEAYGWLKPDEMLDGLALAETTPGPLVLVLSFVGHLATFRDAMGLPPVLAGLLGAFIAAWVTFVPCFLWILLGAPYVEQLRHNVVLAGALAAITAAVVGVILNLAVWFGLHVVFRQVATLRLGVMELPWPHWSSIDPPAVALSLLAFVLLFQVRAGVLATLALCGIAGLALQSLSL